MSSTDATLPSRSKEQDGAATSAAPSKNALKKAQKEKEKAEKAATRKAAEEKQRAETAANDISAKEYGDLPMVGSAEYTPAGEKRTTLIEIAEQYKDPASNEDQEDDMEKPVVFRAVVENAREQSAKLAFLNLGNTLHSIQAVVASSETLSRQMVKFAARITQQSQVIVHGFIKRPKDPVNSASISHAEVHVTRLFVIARAEAPLPIQVEDCERALPEEGTEEAQKLEEGRPIVSLNTRLNHRTIDLRAKINFAIFSIKDGVVALFSEFLRQKGFVGVQTPKLLGAATEGGATVFKVSYFNSDAFLAQSPQFYKQMLIASQFERVFEVGPVFRAENSNTARHLCEFTGLDLEMAFEEDWTEVLDLIEELLLYVFNGLNRRYARETELVRQTYHVDPFKLPEMGKTPRIRFSEGVKMLREVGIEVSEDEDINTPQEKLLGKLVLDKYGTDFYMLTHYPLSARPFYTMPSFTSSDPPRFTNSYDFMMRGQEILSGAQRIHVPGLLSSRMRAMQPPVNPDAPGLKEYVDSFRAGCPPHGGAGIGLERVVMLWLGLPNIRLASAFPRDPGRIAP